MAAIARPPPGRSFLAGGLLAALGSSAAVSSAAAFPSAAFRLASAFSSVCSHFSCSRARDAPSCAVKAASLATISFSRYKVSNGGCWCGCWSDSFRGFVGLVGSCVRELLAAWLPCIFGALAVAASGCAIGLGGG